MNHNFSVSFADSYKNYGLPLIFIQVTKGSDLGFEFLIDTTTKYNWIDPELINFFSISSDTVSLDKSSIEALGLPLNPFDGVLKELGSQKIICKDGKKKEVDKFRFNFNIEGKCYSEEFFISNTTGLFNKIKGAQVVAILGGDFLKKNKWVIDYEKLLIFSGGSK
ncbi:MAG: hypothetical protein VB066_02400 [Paludibacter sp.]|nr:hypothetical protein [Paludibacter sp.]